MALTDNLLAYYRLSDTTDSTGNGNTLTAVNSPSVVSGKIGNCYDFTKTSSQYLHTSGSLFSGTGAYSVSFWVAPTKITTNNVIEDFLKPFGDFSTYYGSLIFTYGKPGRSGYKESISIATYGAEAYVNVNWTTDQRYHICYVHTNATTHNLYINGVDQTIQNKSLLDNRTITVGKCSIGASYNTSANNYTNAKLDEVGIRNRALSSTEVTELYNGGDGNQYPFNGTTNASFLLLMI